MKLLTKVFSVGLLVALVAGCTSTGLYVPELSPQAKTAFVDFQSKPDNKVFVIAVDPSGDFALGYDYGRETKAEAAEAAIAECNANREAYGVLSAPHIYAINDTVVYKQSINQGPAE